jgi:predicted AAA+ superfamily ATPase
MLNLIHSPDIKERRGNFANIILSRGVAHIITGPRRCGKSVFAFQIIQNSKYGYVNFDDDRLGITPSEFAKVEEAIIRLNGDPDVIVLDEIQNVPRWEMFVSRLVTNKRIIITGSNATLLSKELASLMTGRHVDHELLPFSFNEFLDFEKTDIQRGPSFTTVEKVKAISALERYLKSGGFPLAIKLGNSYLATLFRDIVERDVIFRYKIRFQEKIKDLASYLISNSTSEISYRRIGSILQLSGKSTVQNWISYLQNAYLLFIVERFSFKLKESVMAPKKVYAVDTGFMNMLNQRQEKGKLMENAVFLHLQREKAKLSDPYQINYWKDYSGNEVDLVIRNGRTINALINVTNASSRDEINAREIRALLMASRELRCNNLQIITWDYSNEETFEGKKIKFMPIWRWLLQ